MGFKVNAFCDVVDNIAIMPSILCYLNALMELFVPRCLLLFFIPLEFYPLKIRFFHFLSEAVLRPYILSLPLQDLLCVCKLLIQRKWVAEIGSKRIPNSLYQIIFLRPKSCIVLYFLLTSFCLLFIIFYIFFVPQAFSYHPKISF